MRFHTHGFQTILGGVQNIHGLSIGIQTFASRLEYGRALQRGVDRGQRSVVIIGGRGLLGINGPTGVDKIFKTTHAVRALSGKGSRRGRILHE